MTDQIWFEDFLPGTVLRGPARRITEEDIDRYAALTGEDHPVHMDAEFARAAGFNGRIAHGLFALALVEGLKARMGRFDRSVIASLGWDKVRFLAPLEPGDEVHLQLELVEKRASSRLGRGVAMERGSLVKADGTVVVTGEHAIILLSRPSAEREEDDD